MKKRILSFTLIFAMLFSMAIVPAVAYHDAETTTTTTGEGESAVTTTTISKYATPAGAFIAEGETETATPKLRPLGSTSSSIAGYRNKIISQEMSTPQHSGNYTNTSLADPTSTTNSLTMVGIGSMSTGPTNVVNGVWDASNASRILFKPDGQLYNKEGVALTDAVTDETEKATYRYTHMFTYNFGKVKQIEAFGWIVNSVNNMMQAADIYVSNDGTTWTPVGYFDRIADRQLTTAQGGGDYEYYTITAVTAGTETTEAWVDKNGASYAGRLYIFELDEVVNAQYLRIASTTDRGSTNSNWNSNDDKYLADVGSYAIGTANHDYTEMFVFGGDVATATQVQIGNNEGTTYDARFEVKVSDTFVYDNTAKQINLTIQADITDSDDATPASVTKTYTLTSVHTKDLEGATADGYKFARFYITGITKEATTVVFTVTPEIEYMDGTTATGTAATVTIVNGAFPTEATE